MGTKLDSGPFHLQCQCSHKSLCHTVISLIAKCYYFKNESRTCWSKSLLAAPSVPWRIVSISNIYILQSLCNLSFVHKWQVLRGVYTVILCEVFCTWPPTRELHYIALLLYPGKLTPLCTCVAALPTPVTNQWFVDFKQCSECNQACCQSIFVSC